MADMKDIEDEEETNSLLEELHRDCLLLFDKYMKLGVSIDDIGMTVTEAVDAGWTIPTELQGQTLVRQAT